jgi:hypothetical protein
MEELPELKLGLVNMNMNLGSRSSHGLLYSDCLNHLIDGSNSFAGKLANPVLG